MRAMALILMFGLLCMTSPSPLRCSERIMTDEGRVFLAAREGVFTVQSDYGTGSAFLVDSIGLILTNFHVVELCKRVSVQVDDSTRVPAGLVVYDKQTDIAVLGIAPELAKHRPVLRLAERAPVDLAFEGEKVIAIGSPLNQRRIVTSGIVSKVEKAAIVSDVNLNPGSSGGPLLNMSGEVIAINTFRDPAPGSPGVSGSIPISLAIPLIGDARRILPNFDTPAARLLPLASTESFPVEGLKWASSRSSVDRNYTVTVSAAAADAPLTGGVAAMPDDALRAYTGVNFNITFHTPPRKHFIEGRGLNGLVEKRRQREARAGVAKSDMYDPLGNRLYEWRAYVGDYSPLVIFAVVPKIGEASASTFLNLVGTASAAYLGTYYDPFRVYEFKGDLQDFELLRGDSVVCEVFRALDMMPVAKSIGDAGMYDIAQMGVFAFLPEAFWDSGAPDLHIRLWDLKHAEKAIEIPIPRACVEQIWVDFEPYRDMLEAKKAVLILPREEQ